jgi:hypothetical protein
MSAAAIAKAMAALDNAEKQFTAYAEHYQQQAAAAIVANDPKEYDKRRAQAATNYGYATMCGDALEHLRLFYADVETSSHA